LISPRPSPRKFLRLLYVVATIAAVAAFLQAMSMLLGARETGAQSRPVPVAHIAQPTSTPRPQPSAQVEGWTPLCRPPAETIPVELPGIIPRPGAAISAELIGQFGGETTVGPSDGTRLYVGIGPRLVILDLHDPNSPELVGQSPPLPGEVTAIAVSGGRAVVSYGEGLAVIEVSAPEAPVVRGCWANPKYVWSVALRGDTAYVVTRSNPSQLVTVDLMNPSHPQELGRATLQEGFDHTKMQLAVREPYAYISDLVGLYIFDVSVPRHPVQLSYTRTARNFVSLALYGSYALLGAETANCRPPCSLPGGLRIFDISDVLRPREVTYFDEIRSISALAVDGTTLLVRTPSKELITLELAEPTRPRILGRVAGPTEAGSARGVQLAGPLAVVATDYGLWFFDLRNPRQPVEAGNYPVLRVAVSAAVSDERAVILDAQSRLVVVDLTNPARARALSMVRVPGIWATVVTYDHYAILGSDGLAEREAGIAVVDLGDPLRPQVVARIDSPVGGTPRLAVKDQYLYAVSLRGMMVVDLANTRQPQVVAVASFPELAEPTRRDSVAVDLTIVGSRAYVLRLPNVYDGSAHSTLWEFELSDPLLPRLEITWSSSMPARWLAGGERFLYLRTANRSPNFTGPGLATVDLDDPSGWVEHPNGIIPPGSNLMWEGRYLYLTRGQALLTVVDVSNPLRPVPVAQLDSPTRNPPDPVSKLLYRDQSRMLLGNWNGIWIVGITTSSSG
jgi:hypothetical protein